MTLEMLRKGKTHLMPKQWQRRGTKVIQKIIEGFALMDFITMLQEMPIWMILTLFLLISPLVSLFGGVVIQDDNGFRRSLRLWTSYGVWGFAGLSLCLPYVILSDKAYVSGTAAIAQGNFMLHWTIAVATAAILVPMGSLARRWAYQEY